MAPIRTSSKQDILLHAALLAALALFLFLLFFFVYLPWATNHGQTLTVPDVTKKNLADLDALLEARDLRYEVQDCTFVAGVHPFTVLAQYPRPGAQVKAGRKIYVTVVQRSAPWVLMPKLTDLTARSAELALKSVGLVQGNLTYVPDPAKNAVLRQLVNGAEIAPGARIQKGTRVDLELGAGLGDTFDVPNVTGMALDEAKAVILGSSLRVGTVVEVAPEGDQLPGTVVRQKPEPQPGERIRVGEAVDIWVVAGGTTPPDIQP